MKRINPFAITSLLFVVTMMSSGLAGAVPAVWAADDYSYINQYDLNGNRTGGFAPLDSSGNLTGAQAMTFVGSMVWAADHYSYINQYDLNGNRTGGFAPLDSSGNLTGVQAMTFVPEPTTAVFVGLGLIGLGVRRRVS